VESYGYEDGEPVLTLTIPTGGPNELQWNIQNFPNLEGQLVQFIGSMQLVAGVNGFFGLYDQVGASVGSVLPQPGTGTSFSTTEITTLGATFAIPVGMTNGTVRAIFTNTSGSPQQIKIRSIALLLRTAGPVFTDALDVLTSLSGTVFCTPTATVNVPFSASTDYRVLVTPHSATTAFITKSATSFVITTGANAVVDYMVLPKGRILQ